MEDSRKELSYGQIQLAKARSSEQLFYENSGVLQTAKLETKNGPVFNNDGASGSSSVSKCPGCFTTFETCEELQKHIIINIDTGQPGSLRCNVAYQHVFKSDPDARLSPSKPYECRQCPRSFKTRGEIRSHMLIHTEVKPYRCGSCVAEFKRMTELRRHELVHLNLFPFNCCECVKSFRTRGELKSHYLIHSNYRHFKCSECNLEFKRRAELNRHRTAHQMAPSSTCVECRTLTNPADLKLHLLTIHGVRLFKCRYCPAEFVREDDLKAHSIVHATTRFECSVCKSKILNDTRASNSSNLCTGCAKGSKPNPKCSASSNDSLISGSSELSEDTDNLVPSIAESGDDGDGAFICNECDKWFKSKAQLGSHKITHSPVKAYRCLECGAEYRRKAELHRHALIHLQISPFLCTNCNAKFRTKGELKSHMLVHSDLRPFRCPKCRCQYKRKAELKNHQVKCYAGVTRGKFYQKISNPSQNTNATNSSLTPSTVFEPSQWYQPCISLNAVFSHSYRYGFV